MLDAAERLFAQHGIDAVATRQIVLESGQNNRSAALYHFGSRDELIRQLLERRMVIVDVLRHERLDQLVAQGKQADLEAILDTSVGTLATVVSEFPWGGDYIRVAAQAFFSPREPLGQIDARRRSGLTRMIEMAREAAPHLSRATFAERILIVQRETAHSFASWISAHGAPSPANRASFDAMILRASDFLIAGMLAPDRTGRASPKTSAGRKKAEQAK